MIICQALAPMNINRLLQEYQRLNLVRVREMMAFLQKQLQDQVHMVRVSGLFLLIQWVVNLELQIE